MSEERAGHSRPNSNPEGGSAVSSLEEYREQQVAALHQYFAQQFQRLETTLRERLRVQYDQHVQALQKTIEESNQKAIEAFNAGIARVEGMRERSPEIADAYEGSIKKQLETVLAFNRKLLDDFISKYGST